MKKTKLILLVVLIVFAILGVAFFIMQCQPIIKNQKYTVNVYSNYSNYKFYVTFHNNNKCTIQGDTGYSYINDEKYYYYENGSLIISDSFEMSKSQMKPIENSIFSFEYKNEKYQKPVGNLLLSIVCFVVVIVMICTLCYFSQNKDAQNQKLNELEKGD